MKILTVTANTAIDVTLVLDGRFESEGFNRATEVFKMPGGKGNNVARVLKQLGHDVIATGFLGGETGQWVANQLQVLGVETDFVKVSGDARSCYAILDRETDSVREVVEPGVFVDETACIELARVVAKWAPSVDAIVISGSLPMGAPMSYYATLVRIAREAGGSFIALDSSGDALRHGISAGPNLIKPNTRELSFLISSTDPTSQVDLVRTEIIPQLRQGGMVVVSNGDEGVVAIDAYSTYRVAAPTTLICNTVGCGDALLAGYIHGHVNQWGLESTLAFAVACGTAASQQVVAGSVSLSDVDQFLMNVLLM